MGLQLKFNEIEIIPLLILENMETPDTLKKIMKQNSVWFKTTSQCFDMGRDILKKGIIKNKMRGIIGIFNEFRCAINWLGFPLILISLIIVSLIMKEYMLLILFLLVYFIYIIVNTTTTIKIINLLDNKKYKVNIKMIISVLLAISISNIGPIYSIIMNKKEKYKTER